MSDMTRGPRLEPARTVAGPYGPMRISRAGWPAAVVRVDGPGIPAVTVAGATIGVDGRRAPTTTGSGWDPRRKSYTRAVEIGGHRYELRPTGLFHARFTRDAVPVARARGTLLAYNPFRSLPGIDARLTWTPEAAPLDVALGQAMAIAFGAGSPGLLTWLFFFWLDWFGT